MKKAKILSLILALIILFSTLSLSISAEITDARAQLENAISEIEMQVPVGGNYSNESYSALIDSIEEARAMVEDENATDEEMLAQIDKMNAALDGLVAYSWDTDELWKAIERAEALNKEDYSLASYYDLDATLSDSRNALYYAQSQKEVDDADQNSKLNIKDATEIQKHLANLPCNEKIGKELELTDFPT